MEQNFSLTPVHTDKQIQEISNLASVIWHEHFTPIISISSLTSLHPIFQDSPFIRHVRQPESWETLSAWVLRK